jgi:ABC-type dipeptide/oligopeptide/nickel transport system permease component
MYKYILRRLLLTIPIVIGVGTLVFSLLHLVPGDPVQTMFMESGGATAEQIEQIRHVLGLDRPLHVQYWDWITDVMSGDLGESIMTGHSVSALIVSNFPSTLQLTAAGMGLAIVIGLLMGIIAALRHNSWVDNLTMFVAVSGVAMPSFWLGLVLIYIFGVRLRWFPIVAGSDLKRLVLPAFALGFQASAVIARLVRSSLLETLQQDYIRTAHAKGLSKMIVVSRHAMRNSLIPVVTIVGLQFGWLLGGAVIIEFVFARRGIGQLLVGALRARDFPLAQGCVLFVAMIYILVNLMVDILYGMLDPRIRYS